MNQNTQRRMVSRIATRKLVSTSGTSLAAVFQNGSSQARIALDQIEEIVERGIRLIEDSTHKEHIYGEAGDMINSIKELIAKVHEGLSIVSYASAKIDEKKLKNNFPATLREEIDKAVKKDT